jgi:transketolase
MRDTFVRILCSFASENPNLVLITGDLGFGVLNSFMDAYPSQFINAGVTEQAMTSIAAGMALEGKTVYTYSIGNFPTLRCLEQIRNDICYHNANVKIVSVGAGFAYGSQGMSHHATEDIAIMRALPEMRVYSPCDPIETDIVMKVANDYQGPCYIRLGRGGEAVLHDTSTILTGSSYRLIEGNDTVILTTGSITIEALSAAKKLRELDIGCAVYSFPTVKPMDKSIIMKLADTYEHIFTLEEHNISGGFGSVVSEIVAESSKCSVITRLGINDVYSSEVGTQEYLRAYNKLDAVGIYGSIVKKLGG